MVMYRGNLGSTVMDQNEDIWMHAVLNATPSDPIENLARLKIRVKKLIDRKAVYNPLLNAFLDYKPKAI